MENTDLGPLLQNSTSPSRTRPSFMSPTKASLARFHPSLLPQAKSAEPPGFVSLETHRSIEQDSVATGGANRIVGHVAGTAPTDLDSGMNGAEKREELLVTPRRRSRTPGEGNAAAKQSQFVVNPDPRASPPEEARDERTATNGLNGGQQEQVNAEADFGSTGVTVNPDSQNYQFPSTPTQRGPYLPTYGMGIGEDGEPTLPPTPSELGLEPPWQRSKGLLFSSPSRRPRRKRRSSAKSSPLKLPDDPLEHSYPKQNSAVANLGPRRYIPNTPKMPPSPGEVRLQEVQSRLGDVEKQLQDFEEKVLGQLLVSSWQQNGSKEAKFMAKARKEVIQRSADVVHLRDEVVRFQATQSINHGQARSEETDLKVASTKPPSISQRLAKFLPFAIRPRPLELKPPLPKNIESNQVLDLDMAQPGAAPFTITTSNTLLLSPTVNNNLSQRQDVTMSTPQQLLTCNLQLTANITTQKISNLGIQGLSSWAEPELGSWLQQSYQEMELAALGRAFGRYWEVARLRGKCWMSCKQDFEKLVANAPESNSPLLYLGMQDIVFARSNVSLKITWRISLTDQGEVESHSSAYPRFPAAWQQEANCELAKIGDAFMMLVEDRGIPEAIGMICKVVFPT